MPGSEKVLGRWWLQWWWWKLRWKVLGGGEQKKKGVWGETGVEEEEGHGVDVQTKIPYFNLPSTCLARKSISIPVSQLSFLPPYIGYKIALLRLRSSEQRRNKLVKWFFNLTSSQTEAMAPPTAQQRHCPCSSRADNKCKSTGLWARRMPCKTSPPKCSACSLSRHVSSLLKTCVKQTNVPQIQLSLQSPTFQINICKGRVMKRVEATSNAIPEPCLQSCLPVC